MLQTTDPAIAFWSAARVAAHALVRSGCVFATSYPGSPVVGIAEELRALDDQRLLQFRYATNEKIAFEMAAAAALAGQPAACVMKHVGLNVALDAVMGIAYTGVKAPLLLVVGDDPSCESSSTEQDSRQLARFIGIPCIEPGTVDELPEAIRLAMQLSGQVGAVVMVRLTDELSYSGATMAFEPVETPASIDAPRPPFREREYILLPAISRANRPRAIERLELARALGGGDAYVRDDGPPDSDPLPLAMERGSTDHVSPLPRTADSPMLGERGLRRAFVVASAAYPAFKRATVRIGARVPVWRTLMPWPLNEERIVELAGRYDELVVVEALEPVLEEQIITIVHRHGLATRIGGSRIFPRYDHLDEERQAGILASLLGHEYRPPLTLLTDAVVGRGPTFCAGCPHTAFFFGFTDVVDHLAPRPFIGSDIGCYTLGTRSGIDVGDVVLCMGAGLGVATGMALRGVPSIALIGDSTFLHSGLPSLFNAVEQRANLVVCILDNDVSAMTGGQPAVRSQGTDESRLYSLVLGTGVRDVAVVDPFESGRLQSTLARMLQTEGVSVLIARSPCALTVPKQPRRPIVNLARCTGCGDCVTRIHCPALGLSADRHCVVDVDLCVGCGLCAQVCPEGAIVPQPYGAGALQ
jgi:indolepyruvate ferredoxin oxidoreductase alpha subunit